eukprot:8716447-Pyramimonas_sp.AAC.1
MAGRSRSGQVCHPRAWGLGAPSARAAAPTARTQEVRRAGLPVGLEFPHLDPVLLRAWAVDRSAEVEHR